MKLTLAFGTRNIICHLSFFLRLKINDKLQLTDSASYERNRKRVEYIVDWPELMLSFRALLYFDLYQIVKKWRKEVKYGLF